MMEYADTAEPGRSSNEPNGASRASRMTPARLARKRKADRESQRASRLKQKNYIAHLEALVKSLAPSAGSDGVQLLKQQGAENVEIKKALTTICKISQAALGIEDGHCLAASPSPDPTTDLGDAQYMNPDPSKPGRIESAQTARSVSAKLDDVSDAVERMANFPLMFAEEDADLGDFLPHDLLDFSVSKPLDQQASDTSAALRTRDAMFLDAPSLGHWTLGPLMEPSVSRAPQNIECRDWVSTVNLLAGPVMFPLETPEDALDGDIPISAVLRGWDAVEARRPLDVGWKVLRQFDQTIFRGCGIAERMAVLRMMRLTCPYMETAERRPELPAFMLKRPCQEHIKHHPMIDYLVWPGLRERMIFSQQEFATNGDRYTELFCTNFRFLWPFEPEHIYSRNPDTGRYSFSDQFIRRTEDISCWTMHNDYFDALPDLRGDIPGFPLPALYDLHQPSPIVPQSSQRGPMNGSREGQASTIGEGYPVTSMDIPSAMWGRLSQVS